jgi:hypothetical protein
LQCLGCIQSQPAQVVRGLTDQTRYGRLVLVDLKNNPIRKCLNDSLEFLQLTRKGEDLRRE